MLGDHSSLPADRALLSQAPKAGLSCKMVLQAVGKVLRDLPWAMTAIGGVTRKAGSARCLPFPDLPQQSSPCPTQEGLEKLQHLFCLGADAERDLQSPQDGGETQLCMHLGGRGHDKQERAGVPLLTQLVFCTSRCLPLKSSGIKEEKREGLRAVRHIFLQLFRPPHRRELNPGPENVVGPCRKSKAKPNGKKPAAEEKKVYLEPEYTKSRITDFGFKELVVLPREIDLNEWLASNTTTFFHHVNLQYSTISEFCTGEACQTMAVCNT
ncbi:hypothetical protein CB1_000469002 [Camelus ferus]|nr:hypothetical protein CB1_000469002 [Camelus ferus]